MAYYGVTVEVGKRYKNKKTIRINSLLPSFIFRKGKYVTVKEISGAYVYLGDLVFTADTYSDREHHYTLRKTVKDYKISLSEFVRNFEPVEEKIKIQVPKEPKLYLIKIHEKYSYDRSSGSHNDYWTDPEAVSYETDLIYLVRTIQKSKAENKARKLLEGLRNDAKKDDWATSRKYNISTVQEIGIEDLD